MAGVGGVGGESSGLTCSGLGLLFWQKCLEAQLLSSRLACLWTVVCPCPPHHCCSSCRVGGSTADLWATYPLPSGLG